VTQHAACCRCGDWFVLSEQGFGFNRNYIGICPKCSGEVGDLDTAINGMTGRLHALAEEARETRRSFNGAVERRDNAWNSMWGLHGSATGFFAAMGAVALAGKAFETPSASSRVPDWPDANPNTSFADVATEIAGLAFDNFDPATHTNVPFGSPDLPVVATARPGSNDGIETSLHTHIRASNAEYLAYDDAIFNRNEIHVEGPGRINEAGPDFITATRNDHGDLFIHVNDSKMSRTGNFPDGRMPDRWQTWVDDNLEQAIAHHPDPSIREDLLDAYDHNRFGYRQANVNYSPAPDGQGRVTWVGDSSADAARVAGNVMKGVALAGALINYAKATDRLCDNVGNYWVAGKEAEEWQKLLDKIDQQIDETNKKLDCLRNEQENRKNPK